MPAFDLFGIKAIPREWKSLQDLDVLNEDGQSISNMDTKPTFVTGFIVRYLLREGVLKFPG
jgi:hypothetical protein